MIYSCRDSSGNFLLEKKELNYIDVEPRAGILVLFKLDKILHKVLNIYSKHYVIVGWYNQGVLD